MNLAPDDIVPIGRVRAEFTKLAEDVRATGREKLITRNGESYVALVDARVLERYAQLEYLEFHRGLLQDVLTGLDDIERGRTQDAEAALRKHQAQRAATREPAAPGADSTP